jgi:hypothetical protein
MRHFISFLVTLVLWLFPTIAIAQVSDGQAVNATVTNGAFLYKNSDTTALGKVNLNNVADPTVSGSEIFNIQRELNSLSSFTGKPINQTYSYTPIWTNNDVGTSIDSTKARADALTAKFNSSTGHAHTGAVGDGPQINFSSLTGTPTFSDSTFSIYNTSDATKKITLDASGISTGQTRAITMPDFAVNLGALVNANISASAAIAYSKLALTGAILNADLAGSIADTKLSTISTALKVSNSATTAASANTASAIVARDGSGNFSAGTITATLTGNVTGNLTGNVTGNLTGAVTGNASTATALAADPTDCSSGQYANAIAASGNLTCAAVTTAQLSGSIAAASQISGTLPIANGGTGQTTYTDGQLLIGNSSGNTLTKATLTAGSGVTITNGNGSISIAASGGSVAFTTATCTNTCTASADLTFLDGTSNAFTVTVPTPVGNNGKVYRFLRIDNTLANLITITPAAGTINGAASVHAATINEKWNLVSDNTNYQIDLHTPDTDWFSCTVADPTSTASHTFTITSATVTGGDVYSNNSQTFTISKDTTGTSITTAGSGAPSASGTLTKVSGSGPSTLTFSAVATSKPAKGASTVATNTVRCRRQGRQIWIHRLYRQSATSGATAGTGDWVDWTPTGITIDQTAATGCTVYGSVTAANDYLEDPPNAEKVTPDCTADGIVTSTAIYLNLGMAMTLGPNTYRLAGFLNLTNQNHPLSIGSVNYTTASWVWNSIAKLNVLNWEQ